jgi:hypothetical protein
MSVSAEQAEQVRRRAGDRCQYWLMHQSLQGATFHIEHIVPKSKGGTSDLSNLALACPSCNLYKADRTTAIDPTTSKPVSLFQPLNQKWSEHFQFDGDVVKGLTPSGRATVTALDMNSPRRRRIRNAEKKFGMFPS